MCQESRQTIKLRNASGGTRVSQYTINLNGVINAFDEFAVEKAKNGKHSNRT